MKVHPPARIGFACAFVLSLLVLAALPNRALSQVEIASVSITSIDVGAFPEVHLRVAVRDPLGVPVTSVPAGSIRVFEDGALVSVESVEVKEVGIRVAFVIDVGDGVRHTGESLAWVNSLAQSYLTTFLEGRPWMVAGLDEVTVVVQEGPTTHVLVPMSSDPSAAAEALAGYTPPPDRDFAVAPEYGAFTRKALKGGLDELEFAPGEPGKTRALILITPGMRADMSDMAERAIRNGIPIHIFVARKEKSVYWLDALRPLASVTGGDFLTYFENQGLEQLFEKLAGQRQQMVLTYRSTSATSASRQVMLEIDSGSQTLGAASQYSVHLEEPEVSIVSPASGELISRKGIEGGTVADADPTFFTVVAEMKWPDKLPREVRQAQLLVDNVSVAQAGEREGKAEINWDLRSYESEGKVPAVLQVLVEDEVGLKGLSTPVTVSVQYVPAAVRILPTEATLLYVAIGVAVLALGLTIFLFFNRSRIAPVVQQAGESIQDFVDRVTGRRTELVAKAYLIPLEGFEVLPSRPYAIYGTTAIGRSRRNADLLFHIHDEDSPISRLHCTILDEDDHFAVRDEDSTNGTLVNGERLRPLEPRPLKNGDTLDVAPLERGGLRFVFQMASEDGVVPEVEGEIRSTRPRRLLRGE